MSRIWRAYSVPVVAVGVCALAAMLAFGPGSRPSVGPVLATSAAVLARSSGVLHVDDDAPAGGDGLTWRTAFRFLQDALDAARVPGSGVTEIRIAQGEYKPDQGASVTPGDPFAAFWIPAGLIVAGGYAGLLEPDPDARDWSLYETTFNADLLGDDGPLGGFENISDNSVHISRITPGDAASHLSGVRFIRSRAVFSPADNRGGAVNCENGSVVIEDCRFEGNKAGAGGAIGVVQGVATIERCLVTINTSPIGGAMYLLNATCTINDSRFTHNIATSSGGAIVCGNSQLTLSRNVFAANTSGSTRGGAIWSNPLSTVQMTRCSFQQNQGDDGGAVFGTAIADNCEFINNAAVSVGAVSHGGGPFVFRDCRFVDNYASYECGAVRSVGGTFIRCVFEANRALVLHGGAFFGSGTLVNCQFRRNHSETTGGAAHLTHVSKFVNTTFVANQSGGQGGGVFVAPGVQVDVTNCTLLANSGAGDGSAVTGLADIANSVVWSHGDAPFASVGAVTFSCVQGSWPGEGNSDVDPSFVNAPGLDAVIGTDDDDLRLAAGSPCIDSASNAAIPADTLDLDCDGDTTEMIPLDLSGGVRRINDPATPDGGNSMGLQTVVDMGALEFRDFEMPPGDVNLDGVVNIDDLLGVIGAWGPCPNATKSCSGDIAPRGGDGEVGVADLLFVIDNWSSN